MCILMFIYWKDFAEASLSFTEPSQQKMTTRTRTLKVNRPTVEWTF